MLEALYVRPKGVALMPGPPAAARNGRPPPQRPQRKGQGPDARTRRNPGGRAVAPPCAPVRKYLGYSVRLYYDGQLQEVQADPVRLLEAFQAPLTLPAEVRRGQPGTPR